MPDSTLPRMFWNRVEKSSARPAQQFKYRGVWRTLTVEDPAQLAKVLEVDKAMPGLEQIVVIQGYEGKEPSPRIFTWDALRRLGRDRAEALKPELADRVEGTKPDDVATIVYTSGTTGPPKGVVQTHGNHVSALESAAQTTSIKEGDVHLLFLPLAHSFARLESFIGVHRGLCTAFAENIDKLRDNLPETRPHFICSVPRVFEKVYAGAMARAEGGSPIKRKIFHWAVGVGKEVSRLKQAGQPVPAALAIKYKIAEKLVFSKMQAALGGRLRFAVSGGAPLSREIAEFFHAAGILILEGYGLTETCPVLTNNREDSFKFGSVGRALPGVEIKLAPDGEILGRGGNIAKGYFKKPEATSEVFLPDGWFATGDIGKIDADGFLYITDRKKDLIVTAGGMNIAPQNIENLLKGDPFISQAMVHGDRRPYPVALITLNPEEVAKFAREQGIMASDPTVLAKHPKIVERVQRTIDAKNSELQSYAKVKKFAILPEDFTVDNGALTPTLKVKRKVISERHRAALDALYQ